MKKVRFNWTGNLHRQEPWIKRKANLVTKYLETTATKYLEPPEEHLHGKFVAGARVCLVALQKKFNFLVEILHWLMTTLLLHKRIRQMVYFRKRTSRYGHFVNTPVLV